MPACWSICRTSTRPAPPASACSAPSCSSWSRPTFPRAAEQLSLYRAVLDAAGDRPVTFRTLDIGGDKVLPYMRNVEEENPALGWRAIRLGLDRPGAAAHARSARCCAPAAGRELADHVPDDRDGRRIRRGQGAGRARAHPSAPPRAQVAGARRQSAAMVEVPSLLYQLDELLDRVDFLSVGSNDLVQFFYAADRGNARVADRFDPISVPLLRALRGHRRQGAARTTSRSTLCGELASQPIGALALVAIGYRSLSLSPSAVGPVKAMLLDLDIAKAEALVCRCSQSPAGSVSIREQLKHFAAAEGLQL